MSLNKFFNFFGNGVQSRLDKRIPCFNKIPFNFSFLFDEQLDRKWNASIWFDYFFQEVAVNVQNSVRKNRGCIIYNVNRVSNFGSNKIKNLFLKNRYVVNK